MKSTGMSLCGQGKWSGCCLCIGLELRLVLSHLTQRIPVNSVHCFEWCWAGPFKQTVWIHVTVFFSCFCFCDNVHNLLEHLNFNLNLVEGFVLQDGDNAWSPSSLSNVFYFLFCFCSIHIQVLVWNKWKKRYNLK